MEDSKVTTPSISVILRKISDDKTRTLFNSIAASNGEKYVPLKEMSLTTKQYYARISGLLNAGLIKRHKGKYSLTLLGQVVYYSQVTIGKSLSYYWKLKAIESIEISSDTSMPEQELTQLIDVLIDNIQLKHILMKSNSIRSSVDNSRMLKSATIIEEKRKT